MTSKPSVSALLLSGGISRRLGGVPKASLAVAGVPAIVRMARVVESVGLDPVVVVAPPDPSVLDPVVSDLSVSVVRSERSRLGRTASIQEGLRELPSESDVLLWPVDHPFVEEGTVRALLTSRERDPLGRWFVPRWRGRGGHPVLIGHELLRPILALPPTSPLRQVRESLGPQVVNVPVDDPGVAEPLDDWESYHRGRERAELKRGEVAWTGD